MNSIEFFFQSQDTYSSLFRDQQHRIICSYISQFRFILWKKPQAKQPQAKKPQAKQPQAKQPQAKQSQAKQPQAKKPHAKKPHAKKLLQSSGRNYWLFGRIFTPTFVFISTY